MSNSNKSELLPLHLASGSRTTTPFIKGNDSSIHSASSDIDVAVPCSSSSSSSVYVYMIVFFLAMVGHELALEAAVTEFRELASLHYAVTLFQFGFCLLLPVVISRGQALEKFPTRLFEWVAYLRLSLVVFGATALASHSLLYVTYPTKVIFKSAKLIPTMMVSTVIHGKIYTKEKYLAALLLCVGAAGYSWKGGSALRDAATHAVLTQELPGIILLTISVFCDALVPNLQQQFMAPPKQKEQQQQQLIKQPSEQIKLVDDDASVTSQDSYSTQLNRPLLLSKDKDQSSPSKPTSASTSVVGTLSPGELMVNVNYIGFVGLLLFMSVTGHLSTTIAAAMHRAHLITYLTLIGLGLSTAVWSYTQVIQTSGSVVAVAVATLRKVVTILLSYLVFPNKPVSALHVLSGLLVLAGILLSSSRDGFGFASSVGSQQQKQQQKP
jgi:adenosine 3'-phospho 5'-phosphosulfate transporter B3